MSKTKTQLVQHSNFLKMRTTKSQVTVTKQLTNSQKSKTSEWYVQSFLFFKADHLAFFTYKLMAVKVDRMMTAWKRNDA